MKEIVSTEIDFPESGLGANPNGNASNSSFASNVGGWMGPTTGSQ